MLIYVYRQMWESKVLYKHFIHVFNSRNLDKINIAIILYI